MSTPTSINESAPVIVRHSITIEAPIERVWELHTNVDRWTDWQHDITDTTGPSPLAIGTSFTWTSFGFTVTSTVYAFDANARVLWGGEAGGIMGIHEWIFETTATGTLVSTTESFAGSPVDDARDEFQSQLDLSLSSWLEKLKAASEATEAHAVDVSKPSSPEVTETDLPKVHQSI